MISYLSNIEKQQYNRFETMFKSERREEVTTILDNITKDQVVAILDAYDEMAQEVAPDMISIKDCINLAVENGVIEPNIWDISNLYRELAAVVIDAVEEELYELLPEPEIDDEIPEDTNLSKICGETYYSLEDSLTEIFKNNKI